VLKEKRELVDGRGSLAFSLLPLQPVRQGDETRGEVRKGQREGEAENGREGGRTEGESERMRRKGLAVAVAAAALPPHH